MGIFKRLRPHQAALIVAVFILIITPTVIWACGGLFSSGFNAEQSAERMIFGVNNDGTITAVVSLEYRNATAEFGWLLPMPSVPAIDVVAPDVFTKIAAATDPILIPPTNYCANISSLPGGGGGDDINRATAGPYEYTILGEDGNPDGVLNWLQAAGYPISTQYAALIREYVRAGLVFVAMRLRPTADSGDIQPVKLTFFSEQLMIPIRMAAFASAAQLPMQVWIFGNERYAAENWANPVSDFAGIRTLSRIYTDVEPPGYLQGQYEMMLSGMMEEYGGQMFVTEYAGESTALLATPAVAEDAFLSGIIGRLPYVTRLRGQIRPEQMTLDPVFVPLTTAAGAPENVGREVYLEQHVDPLHYWGCSTRELLARSSSAPNPGVNLSERLQLGRYELAYPADWQLTQFAANPADPVNLTIISPESITEQDLINFAQGAEVPPMLIATTDPIDPLGDFAPSIFRLVERASGVPNGSVEQANTMRLFDASRFPVLTALLFEPNSEQALVAGLVISAEAYEQNRALYDAILQYPGLYRHYASPDLPFTLFHNVLIGDQNTGFYIAFAEGWVEDIDDVGVIRFYPEVATDLAGAITMNFRAYGQDLARGGGDPQALFANCAAGWGVSLDSLSTLQSCGDERPLCYESDVIPFADTTAGRAGVIRWVGEMVFALWQPSDAPTLDLDLMTQMIASIQQPNGVSVSTP